LVLCGVPRGARVRVGMIIKRSEVTRRLSPTET